MKPTLALKRNLLSLSLTVATIAGGQLSAQAEALTASSDSMQPSIALKEQPATPDKLPATLSSLVENKSTVVDESTQDSHHLANAPALTPESANSESASTSAAIEPTEAQAEPSAPAASVPPVPGTVETKARSLQAQTPETTPAPDTPPTVTPETTPAQEAAPPAQALETRYQFSYVGAGVNLGFGADSALGDVSFAAYSKFALNPYLSFRPAVLISGDVSFLLPVTYDFPITGPGRGIIPYVGGGLLFSTGDDSNVDLLLSAGVDVPLTPQLTATAGVNIGPFDGVDVGFLLGLAYTFSSATVTAPAVSVNNLVNNAANAVTDAATTAADAVTDAAATTANAIDNALPANRRRANYSYFGAGVNFGITGPTALGDTSFALLSKIALGSSFSVRPSILISNDATFLIPLTYDFPTFRTELISFAPFLGAGLALSTSDESSVDLLLTAGVDVPITREFALTSSVNISPINNLDVGILFGVVYTFGGI